MSARLPTCGRTDYHLPHRYDEAWNGVRLVAWKSCNGVSRDRAVSLEDRVPRS